MSWSLLCPKKHVYDWSKFKLSYFFILFFLIFLNKCIYFSLFLYILLYYFNIPGEGQADLTQNCRDTGFLTISQPVDNSWVSSSRQWTSLVWVPLPQLTEHCKKKQHKIVMPHCKLLMIFDGHKMCYMEDVNKCHFHFQKYSKQLKSNSSKKLKINSQVVVLMKLRMTIISNCSQTKIYDIMHGYWRIRFYFQTNKKISINNYAMWSIIRSQKVDNKSCTSFTAIQFNSNTIIDRGKE